MLFKFLIKFIINKFICLVNISILLTIMFGGFIVNIIFFFLILLFSNSVYIKFNGSYQLYNVILPAHSLLMTFFVVMSILIVGFGIFFFLILIGATNIAFPRMNNLSFWFLPPSLFLLVISLFVEIPVGTGWTVYSPLSNELYHLTSGVDFSIFSLTILLFLRCVNKKIKLSFCPIIGFFITTLFLGNFSYASSDDLPLSNGGNPIGGIIIVVFFMIIAFIGTNSNIDNSKSSSLSSSELDLKDIDKIIIYSISVNKNEISNNNLLDDMSHNKFIIFGIFIYSICVMLFVIHEYLYPKYTKKIRNFYKKFKNKWY